MKKILLFVFIFSTLSLFAQGPTSDPTLPPSRNAADVISVFSGEYTDISGVTFNPNWGQAGYGSASSSYDTGSGNVVLAYTNFNYQGIDFGGAQDVSDMEYLHVDIWINNSFNPNIYVISSGAEIAHSINNTGAQSWISVDIAVSGITGDTSNAIQFKFDGGNGSSDAIYVDNLYFWKEEAAAGTDATLSDLQVESTSLTGFSSGTNSYTYNVVEGTSTVPQITAATTTDSNASAVITQASSIPGDATVVVTAQDGTTTRTYTVSYAYVSSPEGTWKLSPVANATMVGPTQGGYWWGNSVGDVTTRACLFDDEYVFNANGSFENILGSQTWLETWQGVSEGCGTPIAPHDGSNAATWSYDAYAGTITVTGPGAFLGLSKVHNTGDNGAPVNNTITYTVTAISDTEMTLDIYYGNGGDGWWRFLFTKQAAAGTDATLSDLKVDGSSVSNFNYNTTSYTYGLPVGTTVVPTITAATPTDSNATTAITQASSIPGDATVVVTAQDGITTQTYTVSYAILLPASGPSDPTARDAEDVISVFSGAYTDISGTNFNPSWGQNGESSANTSYDPGDGNILLAYPNFNFQGMQLGAAADASAMHYLHVDLWTPADPNATTIQVSPINSGTGTNETLVTIDYTSKTWTSVDIPISSFTGMTWDNVIQMKFAANGVGSTVPVDIYVDNLYFWKDEPTWTGSTSSDWSEASNWDPAIVPTNLADLAIPSNATITVSENITVNSMSVASGASIISSGTITGNITYTRSIPTDNWYLISSPVSGQDIDAFVSASNLATGTVANNVGFANYDNSTEAWSYYQSGSSGTGNFTIGQGHSIKLAASGSVSFTGSFNDSDEAISLTTNTNGFNLIGNPYLASVSVAELLTTNNSSGLEELTVWLWDQSSDTYVQKNLAEDLEISPGQGFFVKASSSGTFDITESMQSHSSDTFQRPSTRPEIELTMTDGTDTRGTDIIYIDGATTGFDNGYDSSIFGGLANDFTIYTHAVANGNGRNLGIQSLPPENYENMIIPVGIIAVSGTDITIDALMENLPAGMNVYLEDKDDNSFTLLDSDSNFTTSLASDLSGIGRFYLHTSSSTLGAENLEIDNLSIYTSSRENLRIVGVQNEFATVQLYNTLGKEVLKISFEGNGVNDIKLNTITSGIYIVKLATEKGTINRKIIIQ